jgi:hypothetical protein
MTTLDFIDVCNILETLFFTDDIDLIWYEQNAGLLLIEALINGKHIEMTIETKTRKLVSHTGQVEIMTQKKGVG